MKIKSSFILLSFLLSFSIQAQSLDKFFSSTDAFFSEYVSEGRVNYKKLKSNTSELDALLEMTNTISVSTSEAKQFQAFWINIYNLNVIKGIVSHYPTKSPLDIAGFFDKTKYSVGGKKITLNDIEHKLLRANFKDPRFHFVLVCAGLGCPPIITEAYTPDKLENQLSRQTKLAINDSNFIRVDKKKKKVEISEIFKWYTEDFTTNGKSLLDYINQYRTTKISDKFKVSYYVYNWNLNEIK
ncbi:MAG: DUF547 domain-containing protein [Flavobacteriaceae bacterium]|nr:DUF547 domain-containing protein [Flavobacteriaceae bacterium]